MTPAAYEARRAWLGLTQVQLATLLGVSLSTVQKRESGAVPINREAERAIMSLGDDAE